MRRSTQGLNPFLEGCLFGNEIKLEREHLSLLIEGIIMLRSSLNGFSGPRPEGGRSYQWKTPPET